LLGMIGSGLQIYTAYAHFGIRGHLLPVPNPLDGKSVPQWARLGGWLAGGLNWHFLLAWPFVITGLLHLESLVLSVQRRTQVFLVDPASVRGMITGWYRGRFPSHD